MSVPSAKEHSGSCTRVPSYEPSTSHGDFRRSLDETGIEDDGGDTYRFRRSTWTSLLPTMPQFKSRRKYTLLGNSDAEKIVPWRRKGMSRSCLKILGVILIALGVLQLFSLIGSLVVLLLPNSVHRIVQSWGRPGHIGFGLSSWPTDFSAGILPIPCHSHNDYWRAVPLFSAIEAGCIGVEADIWLFDEKLYVGHSIPSLTRNRTINSLYIDPLLTILEKQNPKHTLLPQKDTRVNGVFDTTPEQSLIFLIDFKTAGSDLWPYVQSALEPLRVRNYLTRYDSGDNQIVQGPITVVGTGNTPFDLVISDESNPYHDIFFDSPLDAMYEDSEGKGTSRSDSDVDNFADAVEQGLPVAESEEKSPSGSAPLTRSVDEGQGRSGAIATNADSFNTTNSFYASVAFGPTIGQLRDGQFSNDQMDLLRGQIRGAHRRGLKVRYWDLPFWPIGLRNHVWDVLVKEGVDLLNVDDLKGATKRNWQKQHGWWRPGKGTLRTQTGANGLT